jgi:hypothetical protein
MSNHDYKKRLAAIDRQLNDVMRGATMLARPAVSEEGHVVVRVELTSSGEAVTSVVSRPTAK